MTFFGEFSLTSFAYFDILNLRLTERNYSVKSSERKKNKKQKRRKEKTMKRKLISAVALIMCAIMFLFCGCKSKKNGDDTTAPSESGAAVDAVTD